MQQTANYKFKKPEDNDFFNVNDFCDMMDGVDAQLKTQEDAAKQVVQDAETAARNIIGSKADKSILYTATIEAPKWQGDDMPYSNTITVEGLTGGANEIVEILVPYTATDEQKLAWAEAGILSGDNIQDGIILQAFGEKPEINIPVTIIKRGD